MRTGRVAVHVVGAAPRYAAGAPGERRRRSPLLRLLSKQSLLVRLKERPAFPGDRVVLDGRPVELGEAMARIVAASAEAYYFGAPSTIYTAR